MGISTFGSFTQARLGIYAAQAGMSVTGNNISNINTDGYTRQKIQQRSFYAGGADRYYSTYDVHIGNGTLVKGVSQMRDPYLDIRYRSETSSAAAMDSKLAGLQQIQGVLDEVGDGEEDFGILHAHFGDLLNKLHQISDQTGLAEYDIQVRSSAETLAKQFNSYASQLEEIYSNSMISFKEDVKAVNRVLDSIRSLNANIRKAELHGDHALELRDERNLLIDKLSTYVKIDVKYSEEEISGGVTVEKLTIKLDNANPQDHPGNTDCTTLIDGIYGRNFVLPDQIQDADGNMVDNTGLMMSLSALVDSKDRPQYTVTKDGTKELALDGAVTGKTVTDPITGITTITTYEKTTKMGPLLNTGADKDTFRYIDDNGTPTDVEARAKQVPVYLETTYTKSPSTEVQLLDNDLHGSLQAQREFLTETGEFSSEETIAKDPNAGSKRGVLFYQKALDLLANQFAKTFNDANQGFLRNGKGNYVNADGDELVVNGQPISAVNGLTEDQKNYILNGATANTAYVTRDDNGNPVDVDLKAYLEAAGGQFKGGPLFSNRGDGDDTRNITAANISISKSWASGPLVVNSFVSEKGLGVASTDSSNISHMIVKMSEKMNYDPRVIAGDAASTSMFQGDFHEMWVNMGTLLGNDINSTSTILDTYYASTTEIDTSRDSVSSVDLNDEAANLMQYSQSYNAACRLMTTLDAMLDKLINGTGA